MRIVNLLQDPRMSGSKKRLESLAGQWQRVKMEYILVTQGSSFLSKSELASTEFDIIDIPDIRVLIGILRCRLTMRTIKPDLIHIAVSEAEHLNTALAPSEL